MDGGFDANFVEPLSDYHQCPICHLCLREPRLTDCGHEFCKDCLGPLYRAGRVQCPVCRRRLSQMDVYPNNSVKRRILDKKIKCDQCDDGCDWIGELRQREQHNESCGYVKEPCPNRCAMELKRNETGVHVKDTCVRRKVNCQYCTKIMRKQDEEDHQRSCSEFPVPCQHGCGEKVPRGKMKEHSGRQGTCQNSHLYCDYKKKGCKFVGKRNELAQHLQSDVAQHLGLVVSEFSDVEQKLLEVRDELQSVKDQLDEQKDSTDSLECKLDEQKETTYSLECELDEMKTKLCEVESQLRHIHSANTFIFTWKIEHYLVQAYAFKLSSCTFYTGQPGYHLRIDLLLRGNNFSDSSDDDSDDDSVGNIGILLVPCRGDFDRQLQWPFHHAFTLAIINQRRDGDDICRHFSPPFHGAFTGPTAKGFGSSTFVSLEKLGREGGDYVKMLPSL